ncbi:hypothetical protein G3T14_03055 [Methylobacterium sp. BTF04]|uniref:hypothetical protein n=1 Tax=Methylobacterium sp. BTF04 TaxID=2708300 RepID=UPI0013D80F04|nr:hypothetical protein [Methylobacterium sp. BTF04]NEU11108.1 hypothetical protein [Methylobacterium sp. BTF04]
MSTPSKTETTAIAKPGTPRMTMEEATYRTTKAILAQLEPLATLAGRAQGSDTADGPIDLLLQTMQALVEGQARVREGVEALHAKLMEPTLAEALRADAKG